MRSEALDKAYTLRQGVSAGEISAQEALEEIEGFLKDPSLLDSDREDAYRVLAEPLLRSGECLQTRWGLPGVGSRAVRSVVVRNVQWPRWLVSRRGPRRLRRGPLYF